MYVSQFIDDINSLGARLARTVQGLGSSPKLAAKATLSFESADQPSIQAGDNMKNDVSQSISSFVMEDLTGRDELMNDKNQFEPFSPAQLKAAEYGATMSGDPKMAMKRVGKRQSLEAYYEVGSGSLGETVSERLSMEQYDERDNTKVIQNTAIFQLYASRQHQAAELWFPTIAMAPDQQGIAIRTKTTVLQNDGHRDLTGDVGQIVRTNILRAISNPTLLSLDDTRIVPVLRDISAKYFVDEAIILPKTVSVGNEDVETAPLKIGIEVDLISASQTSGMVAAGSVADLSTDTLDTAVGLDNLYYKVGDDVFAVKVSNLNSSRFSPMVTTDTRNMQLMFNNDGIVINKDTVVVGGGELVTLALIKTKNLTVHVRLTASGTCNLRSSFMQVFGNNVKVLKVYDAQNTELSLKAGDGKAVVDAFAGAEIVAYDPLANRSNLNRRIRGKLLDNQMFDMYYTVQLHSPLTTLAPATDGNENDYSYLADQINGCRIACSNVAYETIENYAKMLSVVKSGQGHLLPPETFGAGGMQVLPTYIEDEIDMFDYVDSLTSTARTDDIRSAIVNKMQDMAYHAFTDSEYGIALDSYYGGNAPTPTLIAITDPYHKQYMMIPGDTRTASIQFNQKTESSYNPVFANTVYFTFGLFDQARGQSVNVLNSANMFWRPEVNVVLPISRGGQTSKELAVQPSFLHVQHLPIMMKLNIKNVSAALGRVPRMMKNV